MELNVGMYRNLHTKIVGVTKENEDGMPIQDILEELADENVAGDELELEHEFDNPYDENAIMVYHDSVHIGYLSRDLAKKLVDDVDAGLVSAEISEITGGGNKSYGCNIAIKIRIKKDDEDTPVIHTYHTSARRTTSVSAASRPAPLPPQPSSFDGTLWQMIGWQIVCWAITFVTLGIAYPWGACLLFRWETEHTTINGKRLKFTGTGGSLFFLYLKLYLGLFGILIAFSVLGVLLTPTGGGIGAIYALTGTFSVIMALFLLVVLCLYSPYVLLRIKRWRVEHTEFLHRDPPAPSAYSNQYQSAPAPAPSSSPKKAFDYSARDMARAEVMTGYVKQFRFDGGEAEQTCRSLFEKIEAALPSDSQVVTAFMAKEGSKLCACAMAVSEFILASADGVTSIPSLDITNCSFTNGSLSVMYQGKYLVLTVSNSQIFEVFQSSLKDCQAAAREGAKAESQA